MASRSLGVTEKRQRFQAFWYRHPQGGLAIRTAIAAGLAWWVAHLIPAAGPYSYYAPLGAVVATSMSVVSSLKDSLRAALAIFLGALVALAFDAVFDPGVLTVIGVVAAGVMLAGLKFLGDLGSWVPTAALFVLILGEKNPGQYVLSYGGLILLGGLIGTLVAMVFPQLPLTPSDRAIHALRFALIEQLEHLVDGLNSDDPPEGGEWDDRYRPLDGLQWTVRSELHRVEESSQWNVRARFHRNDMERIRRHARGLDRVAWLVQDVTEIIIEEEKRNNALLGLGREVREPVNDLLRALAEVLRSVTDHGPGEEEVAMAEHSLETLARHVGQIRQESDDGLHVASNVINSTRRILAAMRSEIALSS